MAKFTLKGTLQNRETKVGRNGDFTEILVLEEIFNSFTGELMASTTHQLLCFDNKVREEVAALAMNSLVEMSGSIHSNSRTTADGTVFYSAWLNLRKIH